MKWSAYAPAWAPVSSCWPAGGIVKHSICQPIKQTIYDDDELGVACRSAAVVAAGEELACFELPSRPRPTLATTKLFEEWFWAAS
jgi:hypothetical protein